MPPLFTFGIPVYNAMPYLRHAMESVFAQSYRDFDILVINDGSKDDSWEYLQSLRDSRLRLISQENRKLSGTLNRMLEEVRTPWLIRLDADDVALPDRAACIRKQVEAHPSTAMFYSRACHLNHSVAISAVRTTEGTPDDLRRQTELGYLLSICHSSVVLNVEKTRALGGYRFNLHVEDIDLWWRMALAHDIVFIPEITVAYRLINGSVCISNLRELACNTLYVQHLLLARLWHLPELPYEVVRSQLDPILEPSRFRYRELMWRAAIHIGEKRYRAAAGCMLSAARSAPGRFFKRAIYPFLRNSNIRIGENPSVVREMLSNAWSAVHAHEAASAS